MFHGVSWGQALLIGVVGIPSPLPQADGCIRKRSYSVIL
jgi:hypothetical protein